MAANKPILYSYFRSSCSYRVRIVLAWKGIDYEYRAVNLAKGEQYGYDFGKLNPLHQVPVFMENGHILTQSVSIVEYLEETRPFKPLLPSDVVIKAKVRTAVESIATGIQPLQNLHVLQSVGPKRKEWATEWIEVGFKGLEKQLQPLHGKCCISDDVSLADVFLVPQVFNAERFGVDMTKFPLLKSIHDHLQSYDAFKVSHPSLQPDSPKN